MKGLKSTLNCIKDSETILGGEYYVIHSDFIIALEENINKLEEDNNDVNVANTIIFELQDRIDKALEYCDNNLEFTPRLKDVINILTGEENE